MTNDPLDHLEAFYQNCHTAPVPQTTKPKLPFWTVPAMGLGFGGALALVLMILPLPMPNEEQAERAARALAGARMPQEQPMIKPRAQALTTGQEEA